MFNLSDKDIDITISMHKKALRMVTAAFIEGDSLTELMGKALRSYPLVDKTKLQAADLMFVGLIQGVAIDHYENIQRDYLIASCN